MASDAPVSAGIPLPSPRPRLGRRTVAPVILLVLMLGIFGVATVQVAAFQGAVHRDDFTISGRLAVPVTRFTPTSPLNVVAVVAHGYGASKSVMSALGVELARAGVTAYTFDFPGHGSSQIPFAAGGHTDYDSAVASASSDLEATVDEVVQYALSHSPTPGARVVLIGDSMGTGVVGDYAVRHPGMDSLAAVVLISPVWSGTPESATSPSWLAIAGSDDLAVSQQHVARLMLAMCGQPLPQPSQVGTCGAQGSAREFRVLPSLNHVSIVTATQSITAILDFLRHDVVPALPASTVAADDTLHWLLVGALAAALALAPLLALAVALFRFPAVPNAPRGLAALTGIRVLVAEGVLVGAVAVAVLVQRAVSPSPLAFLGELTAPDVMTVLGISGLLWLGVALAIMPPEARRMALRARPTWLRQIALALILFAFLYLTLGKLATFAYVDFTLTPVKLWRFAIIVALLLPFTVAGEWLHGVYATSSPRLAIAASAISKAVVLVALAGIVGSLLGFVVVLFLVFVGLEALARRLMGAPYLMVPLIEAFWLAWAIAAVYPFVS